MPADVDDEQLERRYLMLHPLRIHDCFVVVWAVTASNRQSWLEARLAAIWPRASGPVSAGSGSAGMVRRPVSSQRRTQIA